MSQNWKSCLIPPDGGRPPTGTGLGGRRGAAGHLSAASNPYDQGCLSHKNAFLGETTISPWLQGTRNARSASSAPGKPGLQCGRRLRIHTWSIQGLSARSQDIYAPCSFPHGSKMHSAKLSPTTNLKSRCVSCTGFAAQLPRLLLDLLPLLDVNHDSVLGFKTDLRALATGLKMLLLRATPGKCIFPSPGLGPITA